MIFYSSKIQQFFADSLMAFPVGPLAVSPWKRGGGRGVGWGSGVGWGGVGWGRGTIRSSITKLTRLPITKCRRINVQIYIPPFDLYIHTYTSSLVYIHTYTS